MTDSRDGHSAMRLDQPAEQHLPVAPPPAVRRPRSRRRPRPSPGARPAASARAREPRPGGGTAAVERRVGLRARWRSPTAGAPDDGTTVRSTALAGAVGDRRGARSRDAARAGPGVGTASARARARRRVGRTSAGRRDRPVPAPPGWSRRRPGRAFPIGGERRRGSRVTRISRRRSRLPRTTMSAAPVAAPRRRPRARKASSLAVTRGQVLESRRLSGRRRRGGA